MKIRKIEENEVPLLKDFLYEAIFQHPESTPLSRDIINDPHISVYIDNWGQKDDYCLLATIDEKPIGAVWIRILAGDIKGYGNIDSETPEFAISLLKEYRKKGYGSLLMKKMIEYMKVEGYQQTSLSVDKENYAVKMYTDLGFKIICENKNDYIMLLCLK